MIHCKAHGFGSERNPWEKLLQIAWDKIVIAHCHVKIINLIQANFQSSDSFFVNGKIKKKTDWPSSLVNCPTEYVTQCYIHMLVHPCKILIKFYWWFCNYFKSDDVLVSSVYEATSHHLYNKAANKVHLWEATP